VAGVPVPTPDSDEFWAGCRAGELRIPRCRACGLLNWFPRSMCRQCSSEDLHWEAMSGRGQLYSFSVVRRSPSPDLPSPYVLALVDLDEGVRLMSHVVDIEPDDVRVGMDLAVSFRVVSEEIALPVFVPAPS
jgi:hypothetical protein